MIEKNNHHDRPLVAITGASTGIGKATALLFAQKGYPVLLMARRAELLEALPITKKVVAKVDVTDFQQIQKAIKKAEAIYGPVDLMINNAGVMPLAKFVDQPASDKNLMIDTNLKGVINGMDAVLPTMIHHQHGTIVNVSSIAGRYTSFDHAVYNATKYGVNGLTEAVRKENARNNVRFILIEPGIVATDLLKTTKNQKTLKEYWENNEILKGGISAESVAETILYAYQMPQEVSLKEIMITHTKQIS